ncbi:MAG: hypothetical protein ACT4TC_12885, partial [Myxococcaceae bacterium]
MRHVTLILLAMASLTACIGPDDDPTTVHDLRVLGVSLNPPELMADACALTPATFTKFSASLEYTALVLDPAGEGRKLRYELLACAWPGDRDCDESADRVRIFPADPTAALSEIDSGEIKLTINPGTAFLEDRMQPLLQQVFEQDPYKGLGGLRMPLVLHVKAGEEELYASKLMVFSCRLFPDQKENVPPVMPGLRLSGEPWTEIEPRAFNGAGPFEITPEDFGALQEPYVVPSLSLSPVNLVEAWKISWVTDYGKFSQSETGGSDIGGGEGLHRVEWVPPSEGVVERDFQIWAVVR